MHNARKDFLAKAVYWSVIVQLEECVVMMAHVLAALMIGQDQLAKYKSVSSNGLYLLAKF